METREKIKFETTTIVVYVATLGYKNIETTLVRDRLNRLEESINEFIKDPDYTLISIEKVTSPQIKL